MKILQLTPNNTYNRMNVNNTKSYAINKSLNGNITFAGIEKQTGLRKFINQNYHKLMNPLEEKIAEGLAKLLQTKAAKKIIEKTEAHPKFNKNLIAHLMVAGSTLLSGFYVLKTLQNDKLDEKKKKTLAINQAAVFALSTIMAYSFDNMITKETKKIIDKFRELNHEHPKIEDHIKGIDIAKKIIIFGTMYRFIAPVIVTPIANAIGNKLNEKKMSKVQTVK